MLTDQDIAKDLRVMQSGLIDQAYRDVFLKMPQYVRALQQTRQELSKTTMNLEVACRLLQSLRLTLLEQTEWTPDQGEGPFPGAGLEIDAIEKVIFPLMKHYGWTEGGEDA